MSQPAFIATPTPTQRDLLPGELHLSLDWATYGKHHHLIPIFMMLDLRLAGLKGVEDALAPNTNSGQWTLRLANGLPSAVAMIAMPLRTGITRKCLQANAAGLAGLLGVDLVHELEEYMLALLKEAPSRLLNGPYRRSMRLQFTDPARYNRLIIDLTMRYISREEPHSFDRTLVLAALMDCWTNQHYGVEAQMRRYALSRPLESGPAQDAHDLEHRGYFLLAQSSHATLRDALGRF